MIYEDYDRTYASHDVAFQYLGECDMEHPLRRKQALRFPAVGTL